MNKKVKNFGFGVILKNYSIKSFLKGAIIPLILSIIIERLFMVKQSIDVVLLEDTVDLILGIVPNLLGFVLSGYALLIGFKIFDDVAKRQKDKNGPTLYQKLNAIFSVGLIMQVFILVFAFTLKLILKAEINCPFENYCVCNLINSITFFFLVFGTLYTIIMIKDLVVNIFNFSQLGHFIINKKSRENE